MKKLIKMLATFSMMAPCLNVVSCGNDNDKDTSNPAYFNLEFDNFKDTLITLPTEFSFKVSQDDIKDINKDIDEDYTLSVDFNNTKDTLLYTDNSINYYLSNIKFIWGTGNLDTFEGNVGGIYNFFNSMQEYLSKHPTLILDWGGYYSAVTIPGEDRCGMQLEHKIEKN